MTDPATNEDLTTYPTLASIADVIELNGSVTLTVDQAGLTLTGPGSYSVSDRDRSRPRSQTTLPVIDDATRPLARGGANPDSGTVQAATRTRASLRLPDQRHGGQYRGRDICRDGSSLGVLGGAESVASTDEPITLTMAGAMRCDATCGPLRDRDSASRRRYRHRTWPRSPTFDCHGGTRVDQAMGLVALQDMVGAITSTSDPESLSDLSVMQATAAVEATNVVAGDVSVKDFAGMIVSAGYDMPGTISIDLAAVQQVTVMTDPATDEDLTTYPTLASVADVIELNGSVTLNVDQAGLTLTGGGSYRCLTPRPRLRARSQTTPRACSPMRPRSLPQTCRRC